MSGSSYQQGSILIYVILAGIAAILATQVVIYSTPVNSEGEEFVNSDSATSTGSSLDSEASEAAETTEESSSISTISESIPTENAADSDAQASNDTASVDEFTPTTDEGLGTVGEDLSEPLAEVIDDETLVIQDTENLQDASEDTSKNTPEIPSVGDTSTTEQQPLIVETKYTSTSNSAVNASSIVVHTNLERTKYGLLPLQENDILSQAALAKINNMFDEQYFEHVGPDGNDVTYWADVAGYSYISVGENLALGSFSSGEAMVDAWMDSPGHRENILKSSYQEIGVAVGYGSYKGSNAWMGVQIFGTPSSACPSVDETLLSSIDVAQDLVYSIESQLDLLYLEISNIQGFSSQEEYDAYISKVTEYNNLVGRHDSSVEALTSMVDDYNAQVNAYNACVSSK